MKYIKELGKLVNIGFSHETAQPCNALVIPAYLFRIGLIIYLEAPEFYAAKGVVVFS